MKTNNLKKLVATGAVIAMSLTQVLPVAFADTTDVTSSTTGASLTIDSPTSATVGNITTAASNQTATGTVSDIAPSDLRGTGAGWAVSMTSTNLGLQGGSALKRQITGSDVTLASEFTVAGIYNGLLPQSAYSATGPVNSGEFQVTINDVTGGLPDTSAAGDAVTVLAPDGSTSTGYDSIPSNVLTLDQGLTVTFSGSSYEAGDVIGIKVDHYGYTQLTVTPASLSGTGSPESVTTNMSLAAGAALSGSGATSGARTDLTAPVNTGLGVYNFDDGLSWVFHANSMAGTYEGTFTYTIA